MSPDPGEPFNDSYNKRFQPASPDPARRAAEDARLRITGELVTVRGELVRVDAKSNTLLAVCGIMLGAAVTFLGAKSDLPAAAAAVGWAAAAAVAVALVLLLLTVKPNLSGDFGFMRWAAASSGQDVLDAIAGDARPADADLDRADELHRLSVLLHGKYLAIRHACTLLVAGLAAGALTAVLAIGIR